MSRSSRKSTVTPEGESTRRAQATKEKSPANTLVAPAPSKMFGNPGGGAEDTYWSSWQKMLGWQTTWARVIAYAWQDEAFRARLLDKKTDMRVLLREEMGYELPVDLDLTVVEVKQGQQSPDGGSTYGWQKMPNGTEKWVLPRMKLYMPLPPPPPVEMQAVALSSYLDTGKTYPFTCT